MTNKMIRRILAIQELLEISNTLSFLYKKYDGEEISKDSIRDKSNIYKLYCASLYNLTTAIKNTKETFLEAKEYIIFANLINQKYKTDNQEYYSKFGYDTTLYKIIGEIRHKCNHFEKDDNDEVILFEVFIDFSTLEQLRIIINNLFNEIYNQIDKNRIKKIVLSKPKVIYSLNKLNEKIEEYGTKVLKLNDGVESSIAEDNVKAMQLFKEIFKSDMLYGLLNEEKDSIDKFNSIDNEIMQMFLKYDERISLEGTEFEKKGMEKIKDFLKASENVGPKEYEKNINKLFDDLKKLKESETSKV